ncbi:hypothetical protein [Psychrobacter sp. ANT_WB68]|uniref:hypothetical protein n=1 Tax=Psychrobacter sp. ANT_WB68 TaxID=2597355 RepID=UPI00165D93E0|nr:hypothetical protein [Psychrobacter sp. ANT_WB68]
MRIALVIVIDSTDCSFPSCQTAMPVLTPVSIPIFAMVTTLPLNNLLKTLTAHRFFGAVRVGDHDGLRCYPFFALYHFVVESVCFHALTFPIK